MVNTQRRRDFELTALPHMPSLFQTARSLLGGSMEAEDAVQETYLRAWKSFDRFAPGTNCRAWMFGVLFNVVRQQRRKRFRFDVIADPDQFQATPVADPIALEQVRDEDLLTALKEIPQQYAEVILLCDVHELSYKEIQQSLNIPIGTVMSRLSRGRDALRAKLGGVRPTTDPTRLQSFLIGVG